jgi:hypothetical protein
VEKLPADTGKSSLFVISMFDDLFVFIYVAKLFDRDPTMNEVLWFVALPMNMSRARGHRYSFEYLSFMATRRGNVGRPVLQMKLLLMVGRNSEKKFLLVSMRNDLELVFLLL